MILCQGCYNRVRQQKAPKIPCACECGKLIPSITHNGSPNKYEKGHQNKFRCGEKHHNYQGGKRKRDGYIQILKRNHPFSDKKGYVLEHRYIMEQYLGRYLKSNEVIHHLNGIKNDNRIENLILLESQADHLHNFHQIDMSTRYCGKCGSNETYFDKIRNRPRWFTTPTGFMCDSCRNEQRYDKFRKNIWRKKR